MSLTRPLCYVVCLLSLVVMNLAQSEEPSYNHNVMKVCHRQKTTDKLMYSIEVVSLNQCAVRCTSDKACNSANICSNGHSKVCTLSSSFPVNKCDNNTPNNTCNYLITETPCLHGGALDTAGHCVCTPPYTGDFCERLYYDCNEPGCADGNIWIQLGSLPPVMVRCFFHFINLMEYIGDATDGKVPFKNIFQKWKYGFSLEHGFGITGFESIHSLTSQAHYTLEVITCMPDFSECHSTFYENFTLGSENERYRLDYTNKSSGPDVFANMKGRPFSAIGNDPEGCVQMYNVAWWYTADCKQSMIYNANGKISVPDETDPNNIQDCYALLIQLLFEGLR